MMKILSILIVNWNTRKLLFDLLTSLYKYPPSGEFEIFIVDNASTDGSQEMITAEFPSVKLLINPSNMGFACAVNRGILDSSGQYVLLLNTDLLVLEGTIDRQIKFMETHPDYAMCGGALTDDKGIPTSAYGRFPSITTLTAEILPYRWAIAAQNRISHGIEPSETEIMPVDFASGATLMIRRTFFESVGLLDEQFFMYFEDADWAIRGKKKGWKVCIVPTVHYIHFGAGSAVSGVSWNQYWLTSLGLLIRKHYHGVYFVICWLLYQVMCAEFALWKRRMRPSHGLSLKTEP